MSRDSHSNSEQHPSTNGFYSRDNELDLLEIIVQLWKGKKTIMIAVAITVLLALAYVLFAKQKWTSKAIVTLPAAGQVANYNAALSVLYAQSPQDKPAIGDLQQQLFSRFSGSISALSAELDNLEEPLELKVQQVIKGSREPLRITFTAESAQEAQKELGRYIQKVNDEVVDDYGADIRRSLSVKTRELNDSLDTQKQVLLDRKQQRIDVIKQSLKIAEASNITHSQLNQAESLSDDTLYLLGTVSLQAMIANEATKPLAFDGRYYETQRSLLAMTHLKIQVENLQSFRYIAPGDLPVRRDSPKRALTVLLSIILGGIIGSGIVIGRVVSQQYRQRKQS
ncbi:LPS O-antigen chain length determinant protein WzzB [Erwinia sp. S43]|uniref:LPS O-antigen chain length determinant protein WzzB n=1 Tax=unclassified Erwinia TaxID=2622719 RepID=UPI001909E7AA|nr:MULTISPECIES: LPS O-antigen chain length determinant protein WzzB [unclassified Erwinia]MBK0033538.1 LPS O-antigen chain length determinant protein WzzB [Erwinia sp. S43]MCW1874158.1 LPS O-antigen chain length determinant protein WzzB [Erwinia sp. INIA01]